MIQVLVPILTALSLLTVQAVISLILPVQRIRPDLLLIFVLYLSFSVSTARGGILAFATGFLLDLFSGNPFGLYAFSRCLIYFAARLFRSQFSWEGISLHLFSGFLFTLLEGLLLYGIVSGFSLSDSPDFALIIIHLLPSATATGLISPLCFALFHKGHRWLRKKVERRELLWN